ncbi:hypothetical protein [Aureivirga sp. CE67]|uniref:hypothetical protein n=1 Tax=Aureivirga sp. CE67 TaxID=1788983 RepID=UPI0018C90ADE|nr:hypothetical protein [Aureivirga sp. CE67]
MAKKGKEKNTLNKSKHTKLMNRKKNKLRKDKEATKQRLKAIIQKANKAKTQEETENPENKEDSTKQE